MRRPSATPALLALIGLPLALFALPAAATQVRGDVVRMKNGGEIRGRITTPDADGEMLTVRTLTGGRVVVERKHVEFVTRRSLVVERYELRAKATPEAIQAQWELAEWCRQNRLSEQRDTHLRRIIELDPEHEPARHALGYSHHDGRWMTREERMQAQGLVKYKGRYITPQELQLLEKSAAELERERQWFKKIHVWKEWLTGRNPERSRDALAELKKVEDPDAVSALSHHFREESDKRLRAVYVEVLSQIAGPKPVPPLAVQSLHDPDAEIRYAALNAIRPDQYATATPYFLRELKNEYNPIIQRAGAALRRVGDERAVPKLIDALVTTHHYRIRVPDTSNTLSFGSDGSFGGGQSVLPPQIELMLRTGQFPNGVIIHNPQGNPHARTKIVRVRRDHQNSEVLAALQKLTGESFGYDERTWRLWVAARKNETWNALNGR